MAELTITDGPGSGTRIELSPEQAYTVGSGTGDSIRVVGAGVGERHVVIKALKAGGFGIKGLAGPFLHNGREVDVARLADGDTITIGDCILEFRPRSERPEPVQPVARELGGFRLLEVLGKGGMGVVYRAEQKSLGREVALKVLSHELTEDPVFVARFVAEARAAARLHHPNVVQVFDVDHVDDTYFYSMELMHEGSLEQRLRNRGKLPVAEALGVIKDAAAGLGFAESLRIVHRDIKPDNLMLDQHGNVKIADLGLAQTDQDDTSKLVGTPHFMSPEQIQRAPLDHRSDLYALGCTFYRLVTGRTPFKRATVKDILRAHLKDAPEPAHKFDSTIPVEVSAIITRLLEKNPADRYQTAQELLEAIDTVQTPPARKGAIVAIVVTAVLVAAGAVWWALTRPERNGTPNTIEIIREDPNAEANRRARREADAKAAYYQVEARRLEGDAKAAALEEMAAAHPDTEFATRALVEARALREAAERQRQAAAARAAAIAGATRELRASFDAALAALDLARAERVLGLESVAEPLRDAAEIQAFVTELRGRLAETGRTQLTELQRAVARAVEQRDQQAVRDALAALRAVLEGERAWPATALGDRGAVERYVADTQIELRAIAAEERAAAEAAAWRSAADALRGDTGIAAAVRAFDLERAIELAESAAASNSGMAAGTSLEALAAALRAAASFYADFVAAVGRGELRIEDPASGTVREVVGFATTGPAAGLTVREGRDETRIPLVEVHARRDELFVIPGQPADAPGRAAFLAAGAVADLVLGASVYLATVEPGDDTSGTGTFLATLGALPADVDAFLRTSPLDWARTLHAESAAGRTVARALTAFSSKRNRTAAELLERALTEHADTLVVHALR